MRHDLARGVRTLILAALLLAACAPSAAPSPTAAPTAAPAAQAPANPQPTAAAKPQSATTGSTGAESIDALYEKAKQEGGKLVFYGTLAAVNAEKILPAFEQRFPGIKVEHVDATTDQLVARAVTEARAGKVLGDAFQTPMEGVAQAREQGLFEDWTAPEAVDYPDNLKGQYWVASDMQFLIIAWNTNLVKAGEEPKRFEDLTDPRWMGKIIAEPRDADMLLAWAKYKYKDEAKAVDLLKKIASNKVEFHKGHSELTELLVAGQAAVCMSCYSHQYPPRIKKGAPLGYSLEEGVGGVNGTAVFKGAPHPNTARLFARWVASVEGQQAYSVGGRTPAHPRVEPSEKTRPTTIYPGGPEDLKDLPKYNKLWKDIFELR